MKKMGFLLASIVFMIAALLISVGFLFSLFSLHNEKKKRHAAYIKAIGYSALLVGICIYLTISLTF